MVANAFDWIVDHLEEFDPFKGGRPFEIKHGQKIGELAILLLAYASLTGDHKSEHIKKLISLLVSVQKNPAFTDRLPRSPVEFVLFVEVYASLRSVGHDDLDQRELIQRIIDARFLDHSERLPHRAMDIVSCLEWGEFRHNLPSLESLYATSILARVPNAGFLDEDAVYFVTHVIMFLYSFGTRRDIPVPLEQTNALQTLFSNLLIACAQEHHWDLLAELLLCWDCIGLAPTFISQRAWEELLKVQKEDGAIPGPEWAERLLKAQKTNETRPEDVYFDHHYHTTLVSIIAGCVHLNQLETFPAQPEDAPVVFEGITKGDHLNLSPGRSQADPLSQDQLRSISRARRWLDQLFLTRPEIEIKRPEVLCKILLGYWICDSLNGTVRETFPKLAHQIGETLTLAELNDMPDWSKTAPALKLIVAALISSQKAHVPYLHHSPDGFLHQAADALNGSPVTDPATDMLLCEKRVLLHAMGLHPAVGRVELAEVRNFARALSLTASGSEIEGLLLRIYSHTLFGTEAAELKSSDWWLVELLAGLAITSLRKYDLLIGCRILRSLCYLGVNGESMASSVDFLSLHQRLDGAFGFFGVEQYELFSTMKEKPSLDIDLNLPITVESLWTLAEVHNSDWRLYQTVPPVTV